MKKIKIKLIGENGNIFNLVGIVAKKMKENGQGELAKEMSKKVFESDSYDNALQTIMDDVDIY